MHIAQLRKQDCQRPEPALTRGETALLQSLQLDSCMPACPYRLRVHSCNQFCLQCMAMCGSPPPTCSAYSSSSSSFLAVFQLLTHFKLMNRGATPSMLLSITQLWHNLQSQCIKIVTISNIVRRLLNQKLLKPLLGTAFHSTRDCTFSRSQFVSVTVQLPCLSLSTSVTSAIMPNITLMSTTGHITVASHHRTFSTGRGTLLNRCTCCPL
jgi:hypothetical protein